MVHLIHEFESGERVCGMDAVLRATFFHSVWFACADWCVSWNRGGELGAGFRGTAARAFAGPRPRMIVMEYAKRMFGADNGGK